VNFQTIASTRRNSGSGGSQRKAFSLDYSKYFLGQNNYRSKLQIFFCHQDTQSQCFGLGLLHIKNHKVFLVHLGDFVSWWRKDQRSKLPSPISQGETEQAEDYGGKNLLQTKG
jgi:hypothetical protein